jgi:hypothetical protein
VPKPALVQKITFQNEEVYEMDEDYDIYLFLAE